MGREEQEATAIYVYRTSGEDAVGRVAPDGTILRLRWDEGIPIGRARQDGALTRILRATRHDESEVGTVDEDGFVHSHGLFEGGALGWLDPDGVVVRGGLILGEEEVGRVEGPAARAAAGALLLIFLPDEDEAGRDMARRG